MGAGVREFFSMNPNSKQKNLFFFLGGGGGGVSAFF